MRLTLERVVTSPAVRLRKLTRNFGSGENLTPVLRGIDLDLQLGEISLLVGQSGSGKTTLLSIIAGLLEPTSGTVEVLGHNLSEMSAPKQIRFRRTNLGFAFQQFNLLPALTTTENVAVPLLAASVPRKFAFKQAADMLFRVGLGTKLDVLPRQLSGGQQQRVAFARALVHDPRLIICDEPTSALDAATGQNVMELLATIAVRPDRAVIIVTHDDRIFRFGHVIHTMDDGSIIDSQRAAPRLQAEFKTLQPASLTTT